MYLEDTIETGNDGNSLSLIDILSCETPIDEKVELKIRIQNLYKYIDTKLSTKEQQILKMRYGLNGTNPLTQREIAQIMGISRSYVSRIEKKSVEKLRKELERECG